MNKYENAPVWWSKPTNLWICLTCKKNTYSEDAARRCCAADFPCSGKTCTNRITVKPNSKYFLASKFCQECKDQDKQRREEKAQKIWQARERKPYDGESMLFSDTENKFFYNLDDLYDFYECLEKDYISSVDDLRIRICRPVKPPHFELSEFLYDCLPDEWDGQTLPGDAAAVEKVVNDYLQQHVFSWEPGPYALDIRDDFFEKPIQEKYVSPIDGEEK